VEIWLYLLAALAFRLTGRSAFLLAGVVGVAALVAIPVLARIDEETFRAAVWALRGLAGFGLGAALWPVHRWLARRGAIAPGRAGLYEGLSLLAIAVVMQMGLPHLIADPVFALAVLAFAFDRGIVSRLLHARFFVLLGTLSYSIYMIHGFIVGRWLDLVRYVAPGAIDGRMLLLPALETNLLVLAILASVVVLSWLSWRLIEHPAREWSRRRAARFGAAREEAAAPTI
jgi:peptidoglycan/LPS O-acetylase OafA/YrhL